VSAANVALGVALVAVGAVVMVVGAWTAMSARRPRWLTVRRIPAGGERGWGIASSLTGLGAVFLGVANIVGMDFSPLKVVGIGLLLGGVAVLVVVTRPRPSP
jgi:hypothetical protein